MGDHQNNDISSFLRLQLAADKLDDGDDDSHAKFQEYLLQNLDRNPSIFTKKRNGEYIIRKVIGHKPSVSAAVIRRLLELTPADYLRSADFLDLAIQHPQHLSVICEKYPEAIAHKDGQGNTVLHHVGNLISVVMMILATIGSQYKDVDEEELYELMNPLLFMLKFENIPQDELINLIARFPQSVSMQNDSGFLPLHYECANMCRKGVICKYLELYPEALSIANASDDLPLHIVMANILSTNDVVLMMIDMYPEALKCTDADDAYPIHIECLHAGRWSIISRCIELYPVVLQIASGPQLLPLHCLVTSRTLTYDTITNIMEKYPALLRIVRDCGCMIPMDRVPIAPTACEAVLQLIDAYPAAVKQPGLMGYLPVHMECFNEARPEVILRCMELYPESLEIVSEASGNLPLDLLLSADDSSADAICQMIDLYPKSLEHRDNYGNLPIHIECGKGSRIQVIVKCIELYPEGIMAEESREFLPLELILLNNASSIQAVLYVIEQYPQAVKHFAAGYHPLHIECREQCRLQVLSRIYELYPDVINIYVDDKYGLKLPFHIAWRKACLRKDAHGEEDDESAVPILTSLNKYRDSLIFLLSKYPEALSKPEHYLLVNNVKENFSLASYRFLLNLLPSTLSADMVDSYHDVNWAARSSLIYTALQLQKCTGNKLPADSLDNPLNMSMVTLVKKVMSISSLNRNKCSLGKGEDVGDHWLRSIITYL
jgi:ankyrin repeat protein